MNHLSRISVHGECEVSGITFGKETLKRKKERRKEASNTKRTCRSHDLSVRGAEPPSRISQLSNGLRMIGNVAFQKGTVMEVR